MRRQARDRGRTEKIGSSSGSGAREVLLRRVLVGLAPLLLAGCTSSGAPECNDYFPVPAGASWGYREQRQAAPGPMLRGVVVESVRSEGGTVEATLRQTVSSADRPGQAAGTGTTVVRCRDGAIAISVNGSAAGATEGARGTVKADLPGLPPASRLVPGHTWQSSGKFEASEGDKSVQTTISRDSRVEGVFPVESAAGSFPQALQIDSTETITLKTPEGDRQARQHIREWYVRGVGLVRRETRQGGADGPVIGIEEMVES